MQSLNKVQIIGFLPRNPEMRYTASGTPVTSFTTVSLRPWVDVKEDKKSPEYINIVAWNKLAEICNQLLGTGSKVFIEGRVQTKTWEDEGNNRRYRTEVVADDMVVLGEKTDGHFDIMNEDAEQTLNRIQIIGNLTRDPERRDLPSGTVLTTFGVATNRSWVSSDGSRQESVEYHNVISWNDKATFSANELQKGVKVFVEGRLQNRSWETPEGTKQTRTEIVADTIVISTRLPASAHDNGGGYGGRNSNSGGSYSGGGSSYGNNYGSAGAPQPHPDAPTQTFSGSFDDDDDDVFATPDFVTGMHDDQDESQHSGETFPTSTVADAVDTEVASDEPTPAADENSDDKTP